MLEDVPLQCFFELGFGAALGKIELAVQGKHLEKITVLRPSRRARTSITDYSEMIHSFCRRSDIF